MSHYCQQAACTKKIPDERTYCPKHELHYLPDPNICEYLRGLAPLAENLGKLLGGSKLNAHEQTTLAYAQGYLQAAGSHLKELEKLGGEKA